MIVSLISDGKTVYRVTASLPELMTEEGSKLFEEPFEIPKSDQIYTIIFGAQLISPNTEIAAAAEILNENENVISLMEGEFWRAQGVSEGEGWAESNLQVSQQFSAKETCVFKPVLIADSVQATVLHPDDYLFFEVRIGGLLTRYFFIAAIIFFFLTVCAYEPTSSERLKRGYFALISKKKYGRVHPLNLHTMLNFTRALILGGTALVLGSVYYLSASGAGMQGIHNRKIIKLPARTAPVAGSMSLATAWNATTAVRITAATISTTAAAEEVNE